MEHSSTQLTILPDEVLMKNFKKLNNAQVLYSLINISKRLDKIVRDPVFAKRLSLLRLSSTELISPMNNSVLDRFCSEILPAIHFKIQWLALESTSMQRILLAADYPNLTGLALFNIEPNTIRHLFTDDPHLEHIFKNQISRLTITIHCNLTPYSETRIITTMCSDILTVFSNLSYLSFSNFSFNPIYRVLSFCLQLPRFSLSHLMELHTNVNAFDDCLYILDGCFDQLHTFYVQMNIIFPSRKVENKKKLPNMRCFSMILKHETISYEDLIVPFLHRMTNLEKLRLFFEADNCRTFIDGNQLEKDILCHMKDLKLFLFNIRSLVSIIDQILLPSFDYVQQRFIAFQNYKIISCVDYFPNEGKGRCHNYSNPYTLEYYNHITNNFLGGSFKYVTEVSLFDERPFEHDIFILIAQAFPFLKSLTVSNWTPQNNKSSSKLNNKNGKSNVVNYPHLTQLDLLHVHDDYVEQFLLQSKTCLPREIHLCVYYKFLQRVTRDFKRDETQINCAKAKGLYVAYELDQSLNKADLFKHLKVYFSHAEIF